MIFFVQALGADVCPKEHPVNESGVLLDERDKLTFASTEIIAPDPKGVFGFCGLTMPMLTPDYVDTSRVSELGLRFDRKEGPRLIFKLNHEHPGHDYYRGCSGAPIINEDEKLVSLVICGDTAAQEIHGLDLMRFKSAIAAEAMTGS